MDIVKEYMDVLQNIEYAIVSVYKQHPDLTDYDVIHVFDALADAYSGEKVGRPPRYFRLSERENILLNYTRQTCELRLGRIVIEPEPDMASDIVPSSDVLQIDEIILCLKKLTMSAKKWNKRNGMRGYLNFISQFVA